MKTIIYLTGNQSTGKSTFLRENNIPEFEPNEFNTVQDFLYKPSLISISANNNEDYNRLLKLIYEYDNATLLHFHNPHLTASKSKPFYKMIKSFLIKN